MANLRQLPRRPSVNLRFAYHQMRFIKFGATSVVVHRTRNLFMSNAATQNNCNSRPNGEHTSSTSHHVVQMDEKMKRLIERLGELVGQAIAEKRDAIPKER
jgi:GH25 family lysozyme M1 (1,4-beta-N-acetylmuramidase)